jgi:hypothetical protein
MIRSLNHSRFRSLLLLTALSAGALTTLFVPPYRELAFMPEDASETASAPTSPGRNSSDVTGIDVDLRHLRIVGSIG